MAQQPARNCRKVEQCQLQSVGVFDPYNRLLRWFQGRPSLAPLDAIGILNAVLTSASRFLFSKRATLPSVTCANTETDIGSATT